MTMRLFLFFSSLFFLINSTATLGTVQPREHGLAHRVLEIGVSIISRGECVLEVIG